MTPKLKALMKWNYIVSTLLVSLGQKLQYLNFHHSLGVEPGFIPDYFEGHFLLAAGS